MSRNQSVSTETTDLIKREKALKQNIGNKTVTLIGELYTGNELAGALSITVFNVAQSASVKTGGTEDMSLPLSGTIHG